MKTLSTILALTLAAGVAVWSTGCQKTTEKGGPGAQKNNQGENTNEKNTFSLSVPRTETNIKPGGDEKVTININRGEQFQQAVTLKFDLPEGVKVSPKSPKVEAGKDKIEVTITADQNATAGKRSVKVTGEPQDGKSVDGEFVVHITKE